MIAPSRATGKRYSFLAVVVGFTPHFLTPDAQKHIVNRRDCFSNPNRVTI